MSPDATARAYYRALDAGEYDALADLLAPGFVHDRPDRTLSGRGAFVRFVRDERPRTDTEHVVDAVYVAARAAGDDDGAPPDDGPDASRDADPTEVAVRGRLRGADGETLFGFVDVFRVDGGVIDRLRTYTD